MNNNFKIKEFALDKKKNYAHLYYMKNKERKKQYYDNYYKNNKFQIKQQVLFRRPKLPKEFKKEIKTVEIKFD